MQGIRIHSEPSGRNFDLVISLLREFGCVLCIYLERCSLTYLPATETLIPLSIKVFKCVYLLLLCVLFMLVVFLVYVKY